MKTKISILLLLGPETAATQTLMHWLFCSVRFNSYVTSKSRCRKRKLTFILCHNLINVKLLGGGQKKCGKQCFCGCFLLNYA